MACRRDWTDAADAGEGRRGEVVVGNTVWVAVGVLLGSWRRVDPAHATKLRITEEITMQAATVFKGCLLKLEHATDDRRVSTLDSLGLDQLCKTGTEAVSAKSDNVPIRA